ncbi:tRNA wybutosine-synthesizing protein 5-like [Sparus aurata]|uniref:tRNA wybutosine-synthesizing protein 5-like n=1 Tax=Sparus aurata TaxID=8175 RepID=UPI0011C12741|nr:tRNA wybutosine-synthesizing protein 5-like [Sparus aurata]
MWCHERDRPTTTTSNQQTQPMTSRDKSEVVDIDSPDLKRFPDFVKAKRYECVLEPGDLLFIPALWFHNTVALQFGVGVNVFWRHLPADSYDRKDPYGNKDPVAATRALQALERALHTLDELPADYRDFYVGVVNQPNFPIRFDSDY